jgi:hypothetical protein
MPPGLIVGPVSVSRSSRSDGCARFTAEQNPGLRRPRANPSHFSLALSRSRRSGDSERPSGARESAPEAPPEALAGERVHPPMSGGRIYPPTHRSTGSAADGETEEAG